MTGTKADRTFANQMPYLAVRLSEALADAERDATSQRERGALASIRTQLELPLRNIKRWQQGWYEEPTDA